MSRALRGGGVLADHQEARRVVGVVLDARAHHLAGRRARPRPGSRSRRPSPVRVAASSAACAVECVVCCAAPGRFSSSQRAALRRAPAGASTRRDPRAGRRRRESRSWWTPTWISAEMVSGDSTNRSSVWLTTPSFEFSIGTTPNSAPSRSTWSKIASVVAAGTQVGHLAELLDRGLVRVGRRRPEVRDAQTPRWSAIEAEMISRNTLRIARRRERSRVGRARAARRSRARAPARTAYASPSALRRPISALRRALVRAARGCARRSNRSRRAGALAPSRSGSRRSSQTLERPGSGGRDYTPRPPPWARPPLYWSADGDIPARVLIGLTGGIGTGKSRVADLLRALGAAVECSDAIVRELQAPGGAGLVAIVAAFGREYLTPEGELDRPKLGKLVFNDPGARVRLNLLIHPLVTRETQREDRSAPRARRAVIVADIPLLLEGRQGGRRQRRGAAVRPDRASSMRPRSSSSRA